MDNRAGPTLAEERQERKEDYEKQISLFNEQLNLFTEFLTKEKLLDKFENFLQEKERTIIEDILKEHPPKFIQYDSI